MGSITEATLLHHMCIVLIVLWFLNSFYYCHSVAYFASFIYLYLVHDGYVMRLTKKLQFEEKRDSNQRRVLSESESVRWLNHAIEKMWLLCMEQIVSQKILLPIVPWFLQKYKPWTVKDIEVQTLYLGRSPPMFTEMRVRQNSNGDDHLVLELGMNFRTADDMSAILGVKLKKRLGFGMLAKLHLLGMHIEGKVLVGVKFTRAWPFISRLRVCFAGPPYFQMTVKPIFTHGLDVTELPGIAGWIDDLLALVFEQTLVAPNMLVVDVEKFVSPQPEENWFTVDAKEPIAYAVVEVLEAAEMKPSDFNGLADPYVKGQLGPYRFRTKIQKKTLAPKWSEEFKIPICTWELQNELKFEVRDKDRIYDDVMGYCVVNLNDLRDGQRHDIWLPLQNIKMGRLHLAVTVSEVNGKGTEPSRDAESPDKDNNSLQMAADSIARKDSFSPTTSQKSPKAADKFEPINIEGQQETGIWIHQPGSEVGQVWESRKGKIRHLNTHHLERNSKSNAPTSGNNNTSSTDESVEANKSHSIRNGLRKIGSVFHRNPKTEEKPDFLPEPPSPHVNIKALNSEEVGVKLIVDDIIAPPSSKADEKDKPKSMMKQARESAHSLRLSLSRKILRKSKGESGMSPKDENELLGRDSSEDGSSRNIPFAESKGESGISPKDENELLGRDSSEDGSSRNIPFAESKGESGISPKDENELLRRDSSDGSSRNIPFAESKGESGISPKDENELLGRDSSEDGSSRNIPFAESKGESGISPKHENELLGRDSSEDGSSRNIPFAESKGESGISPKDENELLGRDSSEDGSSRNIPFAESKGESGISPKDENELLGRDSSEDGSSRNIPFAESKGESGISPKDENELLGRDSSEDGSSRNIPFAESKGELGISPKDENELLGRDSSEDGSSRNIPFAESKGESGISPKDENELLGRDSSEDGSSRNIPFAESKGESGISPKDENELLGRDSSEDGSSRNIPFAESKGESGISPKDENELLGRDSSEDGSSKNIPFC